MDGVARLLPGPLLKVTFRSWLRRGHDSSEQAEAALAAHWPCYANDGAASLVRQVNAFDVQDTLAVADRLANLNVPARVVWGEDDTCGGSSTANASPATSKHRSAGSRERSTFTRKIILRSSPRKSIFWSRKLAMAGASSWPPS
jgi:pimeloyl-ACP methyl ester carboxylesterase